MKKFNWKYVVLGALAAAVLEFFGVLPDASAQMMNPANVGPGGKPKTFTNHGVLIGQGASNVVATVAGSAGQCLTSNGASADPSWGSCSGTGGTGTVTTVSFVAANGFSASIANPTTTPAITMSSTVNGIVKGNGTALSAANAGIDYSAGTSALGTGIVKTTTGTGALSVAVAADFPTLNQNTTGTASNVTGTVAVANGGSGLTTTPANGALNIGNGSGFTQTTLTAGAGISIANGAGSITISSSGGGTPGLVYLTTIIPSGSNSVNALTSFSSTYDDYLIVADGLQPSVQDQLQIRFANAGVVDSSTNYIRASASGNYGAASNSYNAFCANTLSGNVGCNLKFYIHNVNSATGMRTGEAMSSNINNISPTYAFVTSGIGYTTAAAISGFQLYWNTGTTTFVNGAGSIKIYGFNK